MEPLPWYQSAIIRQQIVQLLVAGAALFGIATDVDFSPLVDGIFGGIAAGVAVWTIITRLFKPAPNMTKTAAAKEVALKVEGKFLEQPAPGATRQGGFLRPAFALVLATVAVVALAGLAACAVNPNKTAQTVEQQGDATYGRVVILTEQGARILQDATVSDAVKRPLAQAIVDAKPIKDGLQDGVILYGQVRTQVAAGTNTAAQLAVVDRELAGWIAQAQPIISNLVAALARARK